MRDDIARAYALLDTKGQASITGMRAPGIVKKAFQKLDEFLPDEHVLAVAAGSEPTRSFAEKALYGTSLGEVKDAAKAGRLLVLTEMNFYEVQATGMLNGNKPQGMQIPLGAITDVRVRSTRKLTATERILMVDHVRGHDVQTEVFSMSSDSELEVFASLLQTRVGHIQELVAEQERQERAPVVVQAAAPVSVADELAKLKGLVDTGVLSQDEFEQQKSKLLG